jgi:hypothetical protein
MITRGVGDMPIDHTVSKLTEGIVPNFLRMFKRSPNPKLQYYIYISQSKVEMLVPQIPAFDLRSLEAELKVNVAAFAVGVKKPASAPSPELAAKTRAVSGYLQKQEGWVGTVTSPQRFVRGVAPLQYGVMKDYVAELAFFGGIVDGVKVGLIGSSASLVGAAAKADANHSLDYYVLKFLRSAAGDDDESEEAAADPEVEMALDEQFEMNFAEPFETALDEALQPGVFPPNQFRLEFLAKPLFQNERVLVATPIYVAFAD